MPISNAKRLYVGNLSYSVSEQELVSAFAQWGASYATIPKDESGRSKGFGFVDVAAIHFESALRSMDGAMLKGRPLRVREATAPSRVVAPTHASAEDAELVAAFAEVAVLLQRVIKQHDIISKQHQKVIQQQETVTGEILSGLEATEDAIDDVSGELGSFEVSGWVSGASYISTYNL